MYGTMLSFTKETARNWSGPFEGGYAACSVNDFSKSSVSPPRCTREEYQRHGFDFLWKNARKNPKLSQKGLPKSWKDMEVDGPTTDYPVAVACYGNDDTSYTKYCATVEEAMELVSLLEATQPLDFGKDFLPMGFVFTN